MEKRTLSDEDIDRLASELESRFAERFYQNLGKGIYSLMWRGMLTAICALAAYGYYIKH